MSGKDHAGHPNSNAELQDTLQHELALLQEDADNIMCELGCEVKDLLHHSDREGVHVWRYFAQAVKLHGSIASMSSHMKVMKP